MNILFFSHDSAFYGAPQALFELVTKLEEKGTYRCIVITPQNGLLNNKLNEVGIENYTIEYYWSVSYPNDNKLKRLLKIVRNYVYSFFAIKKIKRIIDIKIVDIIHTNTSVIDIGARIAKKYKIRHVWHIRELLEEHFGFKPLIKDYTKFIDNNSDKIVVISNAVKTIYFKKGLNSKKVNLVYDGIDIDLYPIESNSKVDQKKIKGVFVGQICELKGQLFVVKAISLLPKKIRQNILVDFYGDYDISYYEKILNVIQEYNLKDNFRFLGFSDKINYLLWEYDIGFVCSKFEGFGRTTVEYMLAEVCPIVSDTGANPELVSDGFNGLLHKYGDIEDLVSKIEWVINNQYLMREISRRARTKALSELSLDKTVKEMEKVFML